MKQSLYSASLSREQFVPFVSVSACAHLALGVQKKGREGVGKLLPPPTGKGSGVCGGFDAATE